MQLELELGDADIRERPPRGRRRVAASAPGHIQFGFPDILDPPEETIFFALHPPPEIASETLRLAKSTLDDGGHEGRFLGVERLHVSLLLLCKRNNLPASYLRAVRDTVREARAAPVAIHFDRLSRFGRADQDADSRNWPVVLRGGRNAPVIDLGARLHKALSDASLIGGVSRPFVPHMTLLYGKVRAIDQPVAPVTWEAEHFSLIRSHHGRSCHEIVETFPLEA